MTKETLIIVGDRRSGKTTHLIKESAKTGVYILVANRRRAEVLADIAQDMDINIPFPVTLEEWLRSPGRFEGSSIGQDGLLIDDIDAVIAELFRPLKIKMITITTPRVKFLNIAQLENAKSKWELLKDLLKDIFKKNETEIEKIRDVYHENTDDNQTMNLE